MGSADNSFPDWGPAKIKAAAASARTIRVEIERTTFLMRVIFSSERIGEFRLVGAHSGRSCLLRHATEFTFKYLIVFRSATSFIYNSGGNRLPLQKKRFSPSKLAEKRE
jgi:hypothetical protein